MRYFLISAEHTQASFQLEIESEKFPSQKKILEEVAKIDLYRNLKLKVLINNIFEFNNEKDFKDFNR